MKYLFSYDSDSGKEAQVWIDKDGKLYYRVFIKA